MNVREELKWTQKEAVVTYFTVLFRCLEKMQ